MVSASSLASASTPARVASLAALAAAVLLAVVFAAQARVRARIWTNPAFPLIDSAVHYPDGMAANLLRARRAAQSGDAADAAVGLRAAFERGFVYFVQITGDPAFASVLGDARVHAVLLDVAGWWADRIQRLERPTQPELALLARALLLRGQRQEARSALVRAAALGGPMDAIVRTQLSELGAAPALPAPAPPVPAHPVPAHPAPTQGAPPPKDQDAR